jgi:mannose-1-phosphate guanylyltransferase
MSQLSHYHAVIMAGGVGSRFWPVSTAAFPKQFHDMLGTGKSLLQTTYDRINKIVPTENILILTNLRYKDLVLQQLPQLEAQQVLLEPAMRNTAPCILYAALKIKKENPDAVMLVAPSDHWIEDETAFLKNVLQGFEYCAQNDALVTLGIRPNAPNTGYGYIQSDEALKEKGFIKVKRFTEKPDLETAKTFLASGHYFWNAGIFIWSVAAITNAFTKHQKVMFDLFQSGENFYNTFDEQSFIDTHYAEAENISIDYAILEKASNVWVLPAAFDWNDLGTWGSLYEKMSTKPDENVLIHTRTILNDCSGNIMRSTNKKLIVAEGLQGYIVVETDKALLILPKEKEQDIKQILQRVKSEIDESLI